MIELSLACRKHHHVRALADGRVQATGLKLRWLDLKSADDIFWRMLREDEFDVAELSFSSYLVALDSQQAQIRAIPVFPNRCFRHSSVYVRAAAGIRQPQDLVGRRVGIPEYQMSVGLWVRGILEQEYGVSPGQIHWVTGGLSRPGRGERLPIQLPPGVQVENVADRTLNECLERGEIDALVSTGPPPAMRRGDGAVRELFPAASQVERDYFRRTGIFPIMNTIAIRTDVLDRYPWVASSLFQAFCAARDEWYRELREADRLFGLPWVEENIRTTTALMGQDFFPYGVGANRRTLETALAYAHAQGLIRNPLQPEDLFAPSTLAEARE